MRILKPLKNRSIALLWSGQVFSAVGDEVYNIALIWFAASLMGLNTGYVSSIQAGSIFVFSLIGGVWADHLDHRKVMIFADLTRGFAVLFLPIFAVFFPLTLWVLIPVAVIVSSLSAFFAPAMLAYLPQLTDEDDVLQSANGLMETTTRFARVIGPGLVSVVSRFVPLIHYFTLDALSFFGSAWAIGRIKNTASGMPLTQNRERAGTKEVLWAGFHLTNRHRVVAYMLYSGALSGAAWLFIFPLGMALLVRERISTDIGALGSLVFAYGVGNLSSNLTLSNFYYSRPQRLAFMGRVFAGVGFIFLVMSTNIHQMMISCAIAAVGGPMTDIGFVMVIQRFFRGREIARVHRFGMAMSYGLLLLGLLVSPQLFKLYTVPRVVLTCAIVILLLGVIGVIAFWRSPKKIIETA